MLSLLESENFKIEEVEGRQGISKIFYALSFDFIEIGLGWLI